MAKLRGHGEGTICHRSSGTWQGSISLGVDSEGMRCRKTVYGKTRKEVAEKLALLVVQRVTDPDSLAPQPQPSGPSFGAFARQWLDEVAIHELRPKTHDAYQWVFTKHIEKRLGDLAVGAVDKATLQGFYAALDCSGVTHPVKEMCHRTLKAAFKHAVALGLIATNPSEVVGIKRKIIKSISTLDENDVARFLRVAADDRLYALYVMAIGTALRQGEMLGLLWTNVDLDAKLLSVKHTLVNVNGKLGLGEPKSKSGRRAVTLPEFVVLALIEHKARMLKEGHDVPWVFCDSRGGPIHKSNLLRRSFKPLLKKAGLPEIRFHDLRHTAATLLLGKGVHPKIVQERLGHSSITLTLDTYSHVMPSMQREAASKLDELFGA